jgi:hypothetical protein
LNLFFLSHVVSKIPIVTPRSIHGPTYTYNEVMQLLEFASIVKYE